LIDRSLKQKIWNLILPPPSVMDSDMAHSAAAAITADPFQSFRVRTCLQLLSDKDRESKLVNVGAGYMCFCTGQPRQAGIGFAIRTSLVPNLEVPPAASLLVWGPCSSAYATLINPDGKKEDFRESELRVQSIPFKHRLLILRDFNLAENSSISLMWSNGTLFLQIGSQYELAITNSFFQLANKYSTNWQHPYSKQWHTLDFAIKSLFKCQRDISQERLHYRSYMWHVEWWFLIYAHHSPTTLLEY